MRKSKFFLGVIAIMIVSGIFAACSEEGYDDISATFQTKAGSDGFYAKINTEEFRDYIKNVKKFTNEVSRLNSKLDKAKIKELSEIHALYKTDTSSYSPLLQANVNQIYNQGEMTKLSVMYSKMAESSIALKESGILDNMSQNEKEKLREIIIMEIPLFNKAKSTKSIITRSSNSNESACLEACDDDYMLDLLEIAAGFTCAGVIEIGICIVTAGFGTPAALASALATIGATTLALEVAETSYILCQKRC